MSDETNGLTTDNNYDMNNGQHWVTVSLRDNPNFNEFLSSNSFWPEICCAITCPCYMITRVWQKLKLPSPMLATLLSAAFALPLIIGEIWAQTLSPKDKVSSSFISTIVIGGFTNMALVGVVIYLRKKTRESLGIRGTILSDFCITFPWTCCVSVPCQGPALELASMDRALTPMNALRNNPIPRTATGTSVNSTWGTSLWGCDIKSFNGDLPQYCCAFSCPAFMHLRLLYRMKLNSNLVFGTIFALLVLPSLLFIIASGLTFTTSPQTSYDLRQTAWGLWFYNPTMILVTIYIRGIIRNHYNIHGTVTDDICVSVCCEPCVLAQMERETVDLIEGIVKENYANDAGNYGPSSNNNNGSSENGASKERFTDTPTTISMNNNTITSSTTTTTIGLEQVEVV